MIIITYYTGLNMSLQNLYVEILTPSVMVLGGGGFWEMIRS